MLPRARRLLCLMLALLLFSALPLSAGALAPLPELHCEAALVIHPDTGLVLYGKNPDRQLPSSSLVKIMTAILALEHFSDLSQTLEVSSSALENLTGVATASLKEGEVLTVEQLLYCLLLPSAADAANVLAQGVSGDIESFVSLMNQKAEALSMKNTHYVNTYGRDDDLQYTTASDLAKLVQYALKNQTFCDMVSTQYKRIAKTNLSSDRYYFSNNSLIISSTDRRKLEDYYYRYADGVMTGYSAEAGYNLAACSSKGGMQLISIILGSTRDAQSGTKHHYTDAMSLMDWCYENLQYTELLTTQSPVCEVQVELSAAKDSVALVALDDLYAVIPTEITAEDLTAQYVVPDYVEAPITKDQVIGQAIFTYGGVEYARCDLHAQSDVERSALLLVLHRIGAFLSGKYAKITFVVLILFALVYFGLTLLLNKRRRASRRPRPRRPKRYR